MTSTQLIQATNDLEGLPVELKLLIFRRLPNLQSIHALARASIKYFQVYTQFRCQILFDVLCLQHSDEVDMAEAVVAMRSENVIAEDIRNRDKIFDLLDCRRLAKERKTRFKADSFTPDELMKMMKLHDAAIYFMEDYAATLPAPSWWDHDAQKWELPIKLSHTERVRFFRAFYRLQTWCHIFGQPEYGRFYTSISVWWWVWKELERPSVNEWKNRTFTREEAYRVIWGTMPPWEFEEVASLLEYFESKYTQVFQEIMTALKNGYKPANSVEADEYIRSLDLSNNTPDLCWPSGIPIHVVYELRKKHLFIIKLCFRDMVEIGPYFLYKILQQPYDDRHIAVSDNLACGIGDKLWDVTGHGDDLFPKVPLVSPADKYERTDLAQFIYSLHVLERPNKCWIRHWAGSQEQIHPDLWLRHYFEEGLRDNYDSYPAINSSEWKWGYVLWDDERLEAWNAIELSAMNRQLYIPEDDG